MAATDLLLGLDIGTTGAKALLVEPGGGVVGEAVEEACARAVRVTGRVVPGPGADAYRRVLPRYRALYPALREEFGRK